MTPGSRPGWLPFTPLHTDNKIVFRGFHVKIIRSQLLDLNQYLPRKGTFYVKLNDLSHVDDFGVISSINHFHQLNEIRGDAKERPFTWSELDVR
jgi:hypothetical protein